MVDAQDRLWFGEFGGNAVGMFDSKTEKIQKWKVSTPWSVPYQAVLDKNGVVWTGSMFTDCIIRIDSNDGQAMEYLLPRETNIQNLHVDNSSTPVTVWVGNTHGAAIDKIEPLD